ncbi:hypothetical protein E2C01_072476 [Portunus trituberculatus]|uniref:Uncharacterized protein n=1 Tax=Portunus trituberculatus TaxID=210409 RepID=A0A5B7I793_PORTR|nr:hypothetical protein [Portunus trituberculatus]
MSKEEDEEEEEEAGNIHGRVMELWRHQYYRTPSKSQALFVKAATPSHLTLTASWGPLRRTEKMEENEEMNNGNSEGGGGYQKN